LNDLCRNAVYECQNKRSPFVGSANIPPRGERRGAKKGKTWAKTNPQTHQMLGKRPCVTHNFRTGARRLQEQNKNKTTNTFIESPFKQLRALLASKAQSISMITRHFTYQSFCATKISETDSEKTRVFTSHSCAMRDCACGPCQSTNTTTRKKAFLCALLLFLSLFHQGEGRKSLSGTRHIPNRKQVCGRGASTPGG